MRPIRTTLLTIFVVLSFLSKTSAQDMPPALVVTEPVKQMEFHGQLTLIGRSEARAESQIVAEVSGRVKAIDAIEGRWISKGGPLVSIDRRKIRLALEAKKAQTAQAKADADLAQKELDRVQDMFDQNIAPQSRLDNAQADLIRTLARYDELDAERRQLEIDLDNCTIRAPYDGYTVRQLVQVGEGVSPGTAVYRMVDISVVKVTVDLPERYFGQVEIGSPVAVTVSGDKADPLSGQVSGIAPQASETTHTFPVIVEVPNKDGRLGGGMLVRATVSTRNRFTALAVSKDAIVRQGEQTMIYTVVDGKAARITVRVTSSSGSMVAVEGEGLAEGMPVVVRGNERIFPGSPVMTGAEGGTAPKEASGEASSSAASGKSASSGQ